jgi:hypothetical protein
MFNPSAADLAKMPRWYQDAYRQSQEDAAAETEFIHESAIRLAKVEAKLNRVRVTLTAGIL